MKAPDLVWVGDITYLPTQSGWVYLAVVIDLFSRKVVGWRIENHMRTELCLDAFNSAVALRNPVAGLIYHSDRGSQYASVAYSNALVARGALQSMSRKGNCWDNAVTESFFGPLEQELVQGRVFTSIASARTEVSDYIHRLYNTKRLYSTNGYQSPSATESVFNQALEASAA